MASDICTSTPVQSEATREQLLDVINVIGAQRPNIVLEAMCRVFGVGHRDLVFELLWRASEVRGKRTA